MAYVVISGLPGSGKSSVATDVAAGLRLPLLSKDTIKEALFDTLGWGDREWSHRLGAAAFAALFAVAREAGPAVLETFWHRRAIPDLLALDGPLVEVHLSVPLEVSAARVRERAASGSRHPGHDDASLGDEEVARWAEEAGPLGLGGPLLVVDGTAEVDTAAIVDWARRELAP